MLNRIVLVFSVVLLANPMISEAEGLTPSQLDVPEQYFGFHVHRATTVTPWPAVRFGSWRLWDAHVAWSDLEPEKGKWNFSTLDKYVALAEKHHVSVLLPLGLSPAWASARPSEKCHYQPGNCAEPKSLEDWRHYVRTVATRYKGRIRSYELWNEINDRGFYTGDVQQIVLLARETAQVLKQVDAENILVSPSVYGDGRDMEWLDRFLAYGGGRFVDVIGYHFYVATTAPEAMLPLITKVKRILASYGLERRPLWNTEFGWLIDTPGSEVDFSKAPQAWKLLDMEQASAYISRALILGWAAGVQRSYWYSWDNGIMGLWDEKRRIVKPAARGYARTASWLIGSVVKSCGTDSSGVWYCELSRNQRTARVAWRPDGERNWRVPANWRVERVEYLDGRFSNRPAGARALAIGGEPVLLVSDTRSWEPN